MSFSLLRPRDAIGVAPRTIPEATVHDLGLEDIARQLAKHRASDSISLRLLTELPQSAEEILYRQATVRLLWQDEQLCNKLEQAHDSLKELTLFGRTGQESERPLMAAIWRLGELELYVDLVKQLRDTLQGVPSDAAALRTLASELEKRAREPAFAELEEALPRLRRGLKLHQSVTIGINLDDRLRPVEAALLSINSERYRTGQFLSSFFGKATGNPYVTRTPIHQDSAIDPFSGETRTRLPLSPLFDELDGVLRSMLKPLARELRSFLGVSTGLLRSLVPELGFFISAVHYLRELDTAGFPLCFPAVREVKERTSRFDGLYNLRLARHWIDEPDRMVANDIALGAGVRLYVLTGPNGGGKTTFTQALGLATVLGQIGLPVPASAASISPVDCVYTHFPAEESLEDEIGRFEDEARR
ncbi:MAG: MutS-related protein, partial [Spirochaetales bacterium]